MTRYLLDTNIISNIVKPKPSESLLDWMGDIAVKQTVSERERKNSESRQPGSPEPSAASAGAAGA